MSSRNHSHKITKEMNFAELLSVHPAAADILMKYGMHCIGCALAQGESIEQGASVHGITGKKFEKLMKELRALEEK